MRANARYSYSFRPWTECLKLISQARRPVLHLQECVPRIHSRIPSRDRSNWVKYAPVWPSQLPLEVACFLQSIRDTRAPWTTSHHPVCHSDLCKWIPSPLAAEQDWLVSFSVSHWSVSTTKKIFNSVYTRRQINQNFFSKWSISYLVQFFLQSVYLIFWRLLQNVRIVISWAEVLAFKFWNKMAPTANLFIPQDWLTVPLSFSSLLSQCRGSTADLPKNKEGCGKISTYIQLLQISVNKWWFREINNEQQSALPLSSRSCSSILWGLPSVLLTRLTLSLSGKE